MAPLLTLASVCAAYMLANPLELHAVMLGVGAGHMCDTCQAEHSLCYRWCDASGAGEDRRKRRFRWQAFSATVGYSTSSATQYSGFFVLHRGVPPSQTALVSSLGHRADLALSIMNSPIRYSAVLQQGSSRSMHCCGSGTGALFGGTTFELGGFEACAFLQFSLCCSLAVLMFSLPVFYEAIQQSCHTRVYFALCIHTIYSLWGAGSPRFLSGAKAGLGRPSS